MDSTPKPSSNQPILKTKLFIPQSPPFLIPRPHLYEKLEHGNHCTLTIISGPAGYGKTTLLSEWIATKQKQSPVNDWKFCWLSLESADNDPSRFLTYLTAALESAHPDIGNEARSFIGSSDSLQPQTPLTLLINDLQGLPVSISLVLDDYQFINNPVIHEGLFFLIEHIPFNVHVVIATRSDPPLPLARLRGQNKLNEIRINDLRFTTDEINHFLESAFHLHLTSDQINALEKRTEGWIAGLQMAAISMRDRLDNSEFIEKFSGSNRFVMDYLTEEALNRQPIEIQEFLIQTSILERLSEPLCQFVLDRPLSENVDPDSFSTNAFPFPQNEGSILSDLELSNLFIIPLDDDRTWYRYHHLFADILRARLEKYSPDLIPALHKRASKWFYENGWIEEAINHALLAEDWGNACRLIHHHINAYLENGQMATILKWLKCLPQDVIVTYPLLSIHVAELYSQAGMIDQIDPLLDSAERIVSNPVENEDGFGSENIRDLTQADRIIVRSMVSILRGLKAVCTGDAISALKYTQSARLNIPEMDYKERAVLCWVEGWAYRGLGQLTKAIESFSKAIEYADESGANLRDIPIELAIATWLVGKLPQAIHIINNSLKNEANHNIQNQGHLTRAKAFVSFIYLEQNHLDQAFAHANQAIIDTHWWPSHNVIAIAYTSLAQIHLAQGNLEESVAAIQTADRERKNRLMTPFVHSLIDITWAKIWLSQGDWVSLDQWIIDQNYDQTTEIEEIKSINEFLEMRLIMVARIWMEKTKIDKKIERNAKCALLLDRLINNSQTAGRLNSLVEVLLLKACIQYSGRNINEAFKSLENCLSIAEPGGYMRIFINTGEPARALLTEYIQKINTIHRSFVLKILKEFGNLYQTLDPLSEIYEPITSREMEILHLIAQGYSNKQMAEQLVLTEGTIKFHVHNLLGKLQVGSRTQAISRAKELDLI